MQPHIQYCSRKSVIISQFFLLLMKHFHGIRVIDNTVFCHENIMPILSLEAVSRWLVRKRLLPKIHNLLHVSPWINQNVHNLFDVSPWINQNQNVQIGHSSIGLRPASRTRQDVTRP